MLPDNLASSYDKYKKDTNDFVSWLHATATSCGYHTPFVSAADDEDADVQANSIKIDPIPAAGRLKGKARKVAKAKAAMPKPEPEIDQPKRIVSTSQFLRQAKVVASSSKNIKVPIYVQKLLYQAIKARNRCTTWFANMSGQDTSEDESTATHDHFNTVLERIFEILSPCFEVPKQRPARAATVADEKDEDSINELNNRFGYLEVEDTDEKSYVALPSVIPRIQPTANIEVEFDPEADLPFIVFCFYGDLQELRIFLQETWVGVREGKLSYMTASLVTNVVMELVEKTEASIVTRFPSLEASYLAITSKIHTVRQISEGPSQDDPKMIALTEKAREALERSENGDPEAFERLKNEIVDDDDDCNTKTEVYVHEDTSKLEATILKDGILFTSIFHILEKYRTMISYHPVSRVPSVPPLSLVYIASPESRVYTVAWEEEDLFLTKFMLELELKRMVEEPDAMIKKACRAGLLESPSFEVTPFMDNVVKILQRKCHERGDPVSLAQVFVGRAIVDIYFILGPTKIKDVYRDLRQRAAAAYAVLVVTKPGESIPVDRGAIIDNMQNIWPRGDVTIAAVKLAFTIKCAIMEPHLISMKEHWMKGNLQDDGEDKLRASISQMLENELGCKFDKIYPSDESTFFFDNQPIYNGAEALRTAVALQKLGIELANGCCSFVAVAHLYNFLQQQGLLQGRWNAIDQAIEANMSRIFKGSQPRDRKACYNRFCLVLGVPLKYFAPNTHGRLRPPNFHVLLKQVPKILEIPPIFVSVQPYLDGAYCGERFLFDVFRQHEQGKSARTSHPSGLQLLAELRRALEAGIPSLEIDMVSLVRQCSDLLRTVRKTFKTELNIDNMHHGRDVGDIHPQKNFETVANIIAEMTDDLKPPLKNSKSEQKVAVSGGGDTRISLAAQCVQDFLQNANIKAQIEPYDVIAATQSQSRSELGEKYGYMLKMKKYKRVFGLD